jgi:ribosomal protein S27AE
MVGELIFVRNFAVHMAVTQRSSESEYQCPDCSGSLAARYDSLVCDDCGYTPRHGAD